MNIIKIAGGSAEPKAKIKQHIVLKKDKSFHRAKRITRKQARADKKQIKKSFRDKELRKTFERASRNKNGFANMYIEHGISKPHRVTMRKIGMGFAALACVFLVGTALNAIFSERALPNTLIADINIGSMTKSEIATHLHSQFEQTKVTIISGSTKAATTLGRLGIEIDYEKTAENAINLQNSRWFLSVFNPMQKQVEIIANYDVAKAESFIRKAFANIEKEPASASVIWNGDENAFEVTPSVRGKKLSAETITSRAVSFLSSVDFIDVYAEPIEIIPEIETPDADVIKDYLNNEILGLNVAIPPIANTKSANIIKSIAAEKFQQTENSDYQSLAHTATSALSKKVN